MGVLGDIKQIVTRLIADNTTMNLRPITLNEDKANEMYASPDCQQLLNMYDDFYSKIGFNIPWIGYYVVRQDKIVGSCGFVRQPKDGKVEIAYWTFKEFEGQGIASFACKELVTIAYQIDPGLTITAKTAPQHNASTKILANNNFEFTEIVKDEEIGNAWLWTHREMTD
jgi:[ribosomal protein S5]-alanine N-acetyltransferase